MTAARLRNRLGKGLSRVWLWVELTATALWLRLLLTAGSPRMALGWAASRRPGRIYAGREHDVVRAVRALAQARPFVVRNHCLVRSLLLFGFLQRAGATGVAMWLGVVLHHGRVFAHGWVTVRGVPVLDDAGFVAHFRVIYTLGVAP